MRGTCAGRNARHDGARCCDLLEWCRRQLGRNAATAGKGLSEAQGGFDGWGDAEELVSFCLMRSSAPENLLADMGISQGGRTSESAPEMIPGGENDGFDDGDAQNVSKSPSLGQAAVPGLFSGRKRVARASDTHRAM